jgi:hypothetical protein
LGKTGFLSLKSCQALVVNRNLGDIMGNNHRFIVLVGLVAFLVCISGTAPAQAGASGSFTTIAFPNCDIVLSGGTVTVSSGTVQIRVTADLGKVLKDTSRPIGDGTLTQFTIPFVDFEKPKGNSISVRVAVDNNVIADLGGSYPSACLEFDPSKIPSYLRDGRANPQPGDRIAVWCNKDDGTLDVWGVDNESKGFRLAVFTGRELQLAGAKGITRTVRNYGAVSASIDSEGNVWVAWNGGPFGANGRDSFAKALTCLFS